MTINTNKWNAIKDKLSVRGDILNLLGVSQRGHFTSTHLDPHKILEELSDVVPDTFHFLGESLARRSDSPLTEDQHQATVLFTKYLQYSLWGKDFDQASMTTWVRRQVELYALPQQEQLQRLYSVMKGSAGPCNGVAGWSVKRNQGAGATIWPLSHLNDEVEAGKSLGSEFYLMTMLSSLTFCKLFLWNWRRDTAC